MKLHLVLVILIITSISKAATISVGPISDADCEFNTITDAVNSGGTDMVIVVSNQLVTSTGVFINNKSISGLYGGYDNCFDAIEGNLSVLGTATVISKAGGTALSLSESFDETGSMEIAGFDLIDSDIGLKVGSGASTTEFIVDVNNTNSYNNNTGVFMSNDSTTVNFNYGSIYDNLVGGVLCLRGSITLGEVTSIFGNEAPKGGGIKATGCNVILNSGDSKSEEETEFGVFKNTATEQGGGIYLFDSNFTANGTFHRPASISYNSSPTDVFGMGRGGGFYIGSGSIVTLNHSRVDGNSAAQSGGAVYIEHASTNFASPQFIMQRLDLECSHANSAICSSMSNNVTTTDGGRGGAVYIYKNSIVEIYQTKLSGNKSDLASIFQVEGENDQVASLKLEGDLVIGNEWIIDFGISNSSLIFADSNTNVDISHTTFSNNTIAELFRIVAHSNFIINNSIIVHLGVLIRSFGDTNLYNTEISCSLYSGNRGTNNAVLFTDTSFSDNPEFINEINYGLLFSSPAIDSDCTELNIPTHTDILGNNRLIDTAADLGAYEMNQNDEQPIFSNGFES